MRRSRMGSRSDQLAIPAVVAVANSLADRAPGAYDVHRYATLAEARAAILHRSVSGAYSPGPSPLLLVASAASRSVVSLLEQQFGGAAVNGQRPVVQDVTPLPSSGPNGATAFSILLSLDRSLPAPFARAVPAEHGREAPSPRATESPAPRRSLPSLMNQLGVNGPAPILRRLRTNRDPNQYPQPDSNRRSPA